MSLQGILLIDLLGILMIFLIVNLLRTKKLYVGYAVLWFLAISGLMIIVSVPQFLNLLPRFVGAVYPASAISLLAFIFIFSVLIFFSVQLSTISARQVELMQALAMNELLQQNQDTDSDSEGSKNQSDSTEES